MLSLLNRHCFLRVTAICRMTASGTMSAPYGRVMSGRGFAPASFQLHDKPAAGQLTRDLHKVGSTANMDIWLQQAKTSNHLKLFGKDFLNNQIPSAMSGNASNFKRVISSCTQAACWYSVCKLGGKGG